MEMTIPPADDERKRTWDLCSLKAAAIVQQAGLAFNEILINMVKGRRGAVPHPTILIRVPSTDEKALWRPTLIRIAEMLEEESALDMHVLITEPRGEEEDHAFNIPPDHPVVQVWPEQIVGRVLDVLESVAFVELCVYNWGVTAEDAEPTVVIIVEDEREEDWDVLRERIRKICEEQGAPYLKVAVAEGKIFW